MQLLREEIAAQYEKKVSQCHNSKRENMCYDLKVRVVVSFHSQCDSTRSFVVFHILISQKLSEQLILCVIDTASFFPERAKIYFRGRETNA
jgi:hypothetical protein